MSVVYKVSRHIFRFTLPISRMFKRFWRYGASDQEYATYLRKLARRFGLENHFPIILSEPKRCPSCNFSVFVLMEPHQICGECWIARLKATYPEVEWDKN